MKKLGTIKQKDLDKVSKGFLGEKQIDTRLREVLDKRFGITWQKVIILVATSEYPHQDQTFKVYELEE